MDLAPQESVLLAKVLEARSLTIDFQLPAVLCYFTTDIVSVLTTTVRLTLSGIIVLTDIAKTESYKEN